MDSLAERANSLYWDSAASVNDIADELELSKGSLYAMIEPRGAGLACPDCGAELEYPNRTARERGFLTCGACGLEEDEATVRTLIGEGGRALTHAPGDADHRRILWATALLGAAAGILIARWVRR